jgi:hypothetical protein
VIENLKVDRDSMPGLYQAADQASLDAQSLFFRGLLAYLILLVSAAAISFWGSDTSIGAIASACLFLVTLGILIWARVKKPEDTWYNGRAVAESVKTRSWRWMMRADPYLDCEKCTIVSKEFISDLKAILDQNRSLSDFLPTEAFLQDPISQSMSAIRKLDLESRLEIYKRDRIDDQLSFYSKKSAFNKRRAKRLFWISVSLHGSAIVLLLLKIKFPSSHFPIEVIAAGAGATLTWLQSKKHNELSSSYSLAAHEIVMIKGEALGIKTDKDLDEFVLNAEAAFSREHTQWTARKTN